ncbi:hypothetical protein Bca52824_091913 [Brassica carinata]|uniref:TF-B3 domain-containing protein n=1 Tax=Brassica carinata TaxID=52824 RepID=A0A8X7NVG9_BRACI|nr:hypothetical protein Bca52824_091913 [Brassica carinata]
MDAGMNTSTHLKAQARCPLQEHFLPRKNSKENLDRFIPNRSAMDFDYAHYALTEGNKGKDQVSSPSREAYRKQLAETMNLNHTRILAFRNKPQAPVDLLPTDHSASLHHQPKSVKPRRYIPQTSERTLDAPDIVDDFYLNLLDWGSANVLAIALGHTVYLWDASSGSTSELVTIDEEKGPVTSINWAPDGRHVAVGLNNSEVQLWDSGSNRQLRTLKGCHQSRVGSLAWNNHILTTGGMDGQIVNNDVRIRSHIVETYRGHTQEVCGLKWSGSGQQLASGGNDNVVHIWDRSVASSNSTTQYLHRLEEHTSAVKALAWCPFQANLLATGGGGGDRTIKFWNTHTGACLNSVDTGSQVCSLLWSKNERELLSSHGFTQNQLTLWKYPSMVKMAELTGHTSRVLYMAQSPDGCTVATAAGDETLRFWNVFGVPETAKKAAPKAAHEPFSHAIPKKFSTYCKRKLPKIVTLKSPSGAKYNVGLEEDDEKTLAFRCGWDKFVKDHSLHESDLLVFKFNGSSEFEVLIFDGDTLCEKPTSYFVRKCGHAEKTSRATDFTATSSRSPKRHINIPDDVETTVNQQGPVKVSPVGNELDDLIDIDTMLPQTGIEQEEHSNSDIDTDSGQLPVISPTSKGPISEGKYPIGVFKKMRGQISINDLNRKADVEMISGGSRKRVGEINKKKALSLAKRAVSTKGFLVVMKRSHVVSKCFLYVPVQWSARNMSREPQDVVMQVGETKWQLKFKHYGSKGRGGVSVGWKKFVRDNNLCEGDVCVFEPTKPEAKPFHLDVYIFRAAEAESSNNTTSE